MQETLLPPVAPGTHEELPIFIEADRDPGRAGQGAGGRRQRGRAPPRPGPVPPTSCRYSIPENAVTATGHVRVDRLGDVVTGDHAYYDLDTSAGYIDNPTYRFRQFGARGKANRLVIVDRDVYRAERATYTNCDVGDDDWYLRVGRLDLDRLTDVGVAHNASVYFKDVPILYTPWMDFPLTSRRKTGFLSPLIGTGNNTGFEIETPFYWNIAPNRDYTFSPRLMARRGLQLNNEFRYLEPRFGGEVRFDYLPDDRVLNESRWFASLQHSQRFSDRLERATSTCRVCPTTPISPTCRTISPPPRRPICRAKGRSPTTATGGPCSGASRSSRRCRIRIRRRSRRPTRASRSWRCERRNTTSAASTWTSSAKW